MKNIDNFVFPSQEEVEKAIYTILLWIGEDPKRDGLLETPKRVAKIYKKEIFNGYRKNIEEVFSTFFKNIDSYNQPIIMKNIPFVSYCEHHIMPIIGKIHIQYLPDKKIIGLSKIPRIVDILSHRLQMQESLTEQIADCLEKFLEPSGVAILIEAEHLCMSIRGICKKGTTTITTAFRGKYKFEIKEQENFILMIKR